MPHAWKMKLQADAAQQPTITSEPVWLTCLEDPHLIGVKFILTDWRKTASAEQ